MKEEQGKTWQETDVAYFKVLSQNIPQVNVENQAGSQLAYGTRNQHKLRSWELKCSILVSVLNIVTTNKFNVCI